MKKIKLTPNRVAPEKNDPEIRSRWMVTVTVHGTHGKFVAEHSYYGPGAFDAKSFIECLVSDAMSARDYTTEEMLDNFIDAGNYNKPSQALQAARDMHSECTRAGHTITAAFPNLRGDAMQRLAECDEEVLSRYLLQAVEVLQ